MQFTVQDEENWKLPLLDTIIRRSNQSAKFHRKPPTGMTLFIIYRHTMKEQKLECYCVLLKGNQNMQEYIYLKEESICIIEAFKKLIKLKKKANGIMERDRRNVENKTEEKKKHITITNSRKILDIHRSS